MKSGKEIHERRECELQKKGYTKQRKKKMEEEEEWKRRIQRSEHESQVTKEMIQKT